MANNKIYSDYLMHYRTKGSRNGYSKDPNYTPIGQKAMTPFELQEQRVKRHAMQKVVDYGVKSAFGNEDYEKRNEERDRQQREADAKWRDEMNKKARDTTVGVGEFLMSPLDYMAKKNKETKKAEEEHNKQQDANIEYQRKRAQQAREDRATANKTRYKQQEAIEATKAGHGKSPTSGKSGRITAGFAIADSGKNAGLSGYTRARQAQRDAASKRRDYYHNELQKSKKISDKRNSRSDIGNALADAKSDAKKFGKKVRNVSDFVVEDTADRAKKLVSKGKKKVSKLLKKFR